MSTTLVQPEVVKKWDDAFLRGVNDKFPNLDLVRLERWFFQGKPGNLLEYGFGCGINLIHLLECGYTAEAVDASIEAKKALERKLSQRLDLLQQVNLHHIDVNAHRLPFLDDTFDYVVCMSVLSLLGTPQRVDSLFSEFKRVMKPGAKILVDINGPRSDFAREGESMGHDVYIYRGFQKNEFPVHCYCPKEAETFAELVRKHFSIDDIGHHSHKYFHSEIQEFIVCAHKEEK